MKTPRNSKIMLRACPRCHGDLFPDEYEEDMACLQCGRRFGDAALAELAGSTVVATAARYSKAA